VKLASIRLKRMPGIDPAFTINGLSPGINVVIGPNGSGKTSFRKAVAATLWPSEYPSKQLEVQSEWKDGERRLDAQREGGGVTWLVEGSKAVAPAVPPAHLEKCYTLGVSDLLLSDNAADQAIAKKIRVAMSGGYDLRDVRSKHFAVKSTFGRTERKQFEAAQSDYKRVCRDQRKLGEDEDRLRELRSEAEAAKAAGRLIPKINDALKIQKGRSRVMLLQEEITSFPPEIARVAIQDAALLDEFVKNRSGRSLQVEKWARDIDQLERDIADSGLGGNVPVQSELEAASARLAKLTRIEDLLAAARRRRCSEAAKVETAKAVLVGGVDRDAVPDVTARALSRSGKLFRKRESERERRYALEHEIAALSVRKPDEDTRTLEAASGLLRDWLSAPVAVVPAVGMLKTLLVVAFVVALVGVVLATVDHLLWLLVAGVGAGAGGAAGLIFASQGTADGGDETAERDRHARRFAELNLGSPEAWAPEEVRALLRELDGRQGDAVLGDKADERRELLVGQLRKHVVDESATEAERQALLAEIGIELGEDLALHEIAARCRQYTDACVALAEVDGEIERLSNDFDDLRNVVDDFLTKYGYEVAADNAEREAYLKSLERKLDTYMTASEQLASARFDLAAEHKLVSEFDRKIRAFYEDRGLNVDDRRQLDALLEQRPNYDKLTRELSADMRSLGELEAGLGAHAALLELDEAQLEQRKDDATSKSSETDEVILEIGAIEERVKAATRGSEAEEALAAVEKARDILLEASAKAQMAAAGRFLLDYVDEEHEKASRPVVLERAMLHFGAFTHNAFELVLTDDENGGFRARNTTTREPLELAQLSEGTRIQLLLAVRLAFATNAERGSSIPLMFDEALSTSDPDRFVAVAEALAVLAADGRQIFYLTSNPADVAAWIAAARQGTALVPTIVDLGRIRWRQAAIKNVDELKLPVRAAVSKPNGLAPEEYALALGVPAANVHAPIEALPLFYMLRDDLQLLYELIEKYRIDTVGKWLSFSQSGRADKLLAPQACERLDAFCAGAREVQRAATVGRGKPVDRHVFADTGPVSDRFMPVLLELIHNTGGDAQAILKSIDDGVKGFRRDKRADLQDYFEERGYLDANPKLEIATIYARTVGVMATAVDEGVVTQDECVALADRLVGAFGF
jgi:exonuclease SbcC